jgi:hypothetical protein
MIGAQTDITVEQNLQEKLNLWNKIQSRLWTFFACIAFGSLDGLTLMSTNNFATY